jgi:hypothetical protein
MAVVTITLSPHTMGDDHPVPGSLIFQRTFFPGPHSVGSFVSAVRLVPLGPRNCGQSLD